MSPPRTVLMFAHECAPHHRARSTVGAQRPAQFAKYLPEFGWRAVVVCCDAQARRSLDPEELDVVDALVDDALSSSDPQASLVIATPSLTHDGLLDRAWIHSVEERGRSGPLRRAARRALTAAKFVRGDYSQSWQPCARRAASRLASRISVDAVLGEHSPDAGLFLARWFSHAYGVPWVLDLRDPILSPFRGVSRRVYRPIARRLVRSAAATIAVTPRWAAFDRQLFGRPVHCIPNGFDPEDYVSPPPPPGSGEPLQIVYSGNVGIYLKGLRVFFDGLRSIVEQLGQTSQHALRFQYLGLAGADVDQIAREAGVSDFVECRGFVARSEAMRALQQAGVLLLLSGTSEDPLFAHGMYPAKAFEYFGASRPILCVPGDAELTELLRRTGTGHIARDAVAVSSYLRERLDWLASGRELHYAPNPDEVEACTRRSRSATLGQVLDGLIDQGVP
jgi:glycosyltransferase involved in cell wall biosynthesis